MKVFSRMEGLGGFCSKGRRVDLNAEENKYNKVRAVQTPVLDLQSVNLSRIQGQRAYGALGEV